MRTSNSIKNTIITFIACLCNTILGAVSLTLFIRILDVEYIGINGLFSNVLSMLSIAELGIGNAIIVNLYKPVYENDKEKIKSLMHFYKKAYNIIAVIMFSVGILIIPFLKYIIKDATVPVNLVIVYILHLTTVVSPYLFAYKRAILTANQKSYVMKLIEIVYLFICSFFQILILYVTRNYYLYLIVKIICQIIKNIIISIIVNKKYQFVKDKNYQKLDKQTEKDILSKVGALSLHKVSNFVVNGTDNIIISTFLGLTPVGLYSNYNMVIKNVKEIFYQIITSITASVGNLLVEGNKDKLFKTYKKIRFFNTWLSLFSSICLLVIMQDFICLWIGKKYLLSPIVLIVLVLNYYQSLLQRNYKLFKDAAGIWKEDKYVPIIVAILNIILSIVLLKLYGLVGVFMGTIASSLVYWIYSFPKLIYKGLFNKSYKSYILEILSYIFLLTSLSFITYKVTSLFIIKNILLKVIVDIIVCCFAPNVILLILFHRTEEYKYFYNLLKNILKKINKNKYKSHIFKTKSDLYVNFEKDTNMIIVTGISGSGKSKTSNELKSKYNYEIVSFDFIFNYEFERKPSSLERKLLKEFKNKYLQYKDYKKNTENKTEVCNCFFDFISEYLKENNIKIIFDGAYFLDRISFDKIKNERIVIKRTSIIRSNFQKVNRNKKYLIHPNISIIKKSKSILGMHFECFKQIINQKKKVNKFLKKCEKLNIK